MDKLYKKKYKVSIIFFTCYTDPNLDNRIHVMMVYKLLTLKINEASHICYVSTG